jgi:hypothetical protein
MSRFQLKRKYLSASFELATGVDKRSLISGGKSKFPFPSQEETLSWFIKVFYSQTDAQVNCLKNNFKIYIKTNIERATTCFGAITPSIREGIIRAC